MRVLHALAGAAVAAGVFVLALPGANAQDPAASVPFRPLASRNATCPVRGTPVAEFRANPQAYLSVLRADSAISGKIAQAEAAWAASHPGR